MDCACLRCPCCASALQRAVAQSSVNGGHIIHKFSMFIDSKPVLFISPEMFTDVHSTGFDPAVSTVGSMHSTSLQLLEAIDLSHDGYGYGENVTVATCALASQLEKEGRLTPEILPATGQMIAKKPLLRSEPNRNSNSPATGGQFSRNGFLKFLLLEDCFGMIKRSVFDAFVLVFVLPNQTSS